MSPRNLRERKKNILVIRDRVSAVRLEKRKREKDRRPRKKKVKYRM